RCTGRSEMGRKGGQNGLSCAIFSAYSTRVNAGIAQLVEQLICNQQVVGSNPTAGSIVNAISTPYNRPVSDLEVTYLLFPPTRRLLRPIWINPSALPKTCPRSRQD